MASALAQARDKLNQADACNSNHGDNVVQAFQTIAMALAEKPDAPQSTQLAHASRRLSAQASGSAQFCAQGLAEPSRQAEDGTLDVAEAMRLAQVLLGGGKPAGSDTGLDDVLAGVVGSLAQGASRKRAGSDDLVSAGLDFLSPPSSAHRRGSSWLPVCSSP